MPTSLFSDFLEVDQMKLSSWRPDLNADITEPPMKCERCLRKVSPRLSKLHPYPIAYEARQCTHANYDTRFQLRFHMSDVAIFIPGWPEEFSPDQHPPSFLRMDFGKYSADLFLLRFLQTTSSILL